MPKKGVNIEEIGANLAAFALNAEDTALCLQELPETGRTDDTAMESELRCLRVFAVDFAIAKALSKNKSKKEAVSNAYLALLQEILEKLPNNIGQAMLEMLMDRIDKYVDVSRLFQSEDPFFVIGQTFATFCEESTNIDLSLFGKEMFLSTAYGAVEYLESMGV